MTSEEIDLLLANSEKALKREILPIPILSWVVSVVTLSLGIVFSSFEFLVAFPVLFLVSLSANYGYRERWREIQTRRTQLIWRHLKLSVFAYQLNPNTEILVSNITSLYQTDPRGEILPLSQAIRLVDTHHKQQKRLKIVLQRLTQLRSVSVALRDKTEQLRDLGDSHLQGETRLQSLLNDETALDTMREQILASCHRLELILIETQKAQQMRQLHREISALTAEKSLPVTSNTDFEPDSLLHIERQITREIETFLQLERETDRHLREL